MFQKLFPKIIYVISILLLSSFASADFAPSVSIDQKDAQEYVETISYYLTNYEDRKSADYVEEKYTIAAEKIQLILKNKNLTDAYIFILEYLLYHTQTWLLENTEAPATDSDTSSNSSQNSQETETISFGEYESGAKTIVAGEWSDVVTEFEITARIEGVIAKQLSITSSSNSFGDSIEEVLLIDTNGHVIGRDSPSGNTAVFKDAIVFPVGTTKLYILLKPYTIGRSVFAVQEGVPFTLGFSIDDATGETSGNTYSTNLKINNEDAITISPIKLGNISLEDTYNGKRVDQYLSNGQTNLAIISIPVGDTENITRNTGSEVDMIMQDITINYRDNTVAGNTANTFQLERIDINNSPSISPVTSSNNQAKFDLNDLGNKNIVEPGSTAVFLLTASPSLDSSVFESIVIELDNELSTTQGLLTYTSNEYNSVSFTSLGNGQRFIGSITTNDPN